MLPPRVPESQYIQDCLLRLDSRIRINKDIIGPKQEINFINRTGQNLRVNISVEEMMPAEYLKKEFDRWKLDESRGFRDAASHYSHARVGSTSHSKAREAETLASPEQYSVGSSLIRSQVPVERNFQQPFKQDDTERRYHSSSVSA